MCFISDQHEFVQSCSIQNKCILNLVGSQPWTKQCQNISYGRRRSSRGLVCQDKRQRTMDSSKSRENRGGDQNRDPRATRLRTVGHKIQGVLQHGRSALHSSESGESLKN